MAFQDSTFSGSRTSQQFPHDFDFSVLADLTQVFREHLPGVLPDSIRLERKGRQDHCELEGAHKSPPKSIPEG